MGRSSVRSIRYLLTLTLAFSVAFSARAQSSGNRDRDPALAQAKTLATEIQSANYHWGPLYLLSRIQVSDVGFGYSYYFPTEEGTQGVSMSVAAPQKFFFVPRKKLIFTAQATPAYSFFVGGNRKGQFDYDLRGDAHFLLNHIYADLYVLGSDKLRSQPADFNRMATVKTSTYGLNGEYKVSSRTSLLVTTNASKLTYPGGSRYQPEHVPVYLLARKELNGRVALLHKTFPLTSFRLGVEASDYSFTNASSKDALRWRVSPGLNYDGSRVDMQLEAGPTRLDFTDASREDFSGITGQMGITRASRRWNLNASAERDLEFSIMQANDYFVATRATAGLTYAVTSRLSLRGNTTAERDEYPVELNGILRRDDIRFTTVGFRYSRWRLGGGVDVGPYSRRSNLAGDDESGIRWVIDLSLTL